MSPPLKETGNYSLEKESDRLLRRRHPDFEAITSEHGELAGSGPSRFEQDQLKHHSLKCP